MEGFPTLNARDLGLGSGHIAYRHESIIDLYIYAKFHWNQRNFMWKNRRVYEWTFETGFIRSRVDL